LQVAWLPRGTGKTFDFVCVVLLEGCNGGEQEEGILGTCNRAAKQSLHSLMLPFSSGLGKRSGIF